MAKRPAIGELLLGGVVIALVGFVGSQVVASPARKPTRSTRALSGRDSAAIVSQYRNQLSSRREQYSLPPWIADVQIARLEAAAARDVSGLDSIPKLSPDSVRSLIAAAQTGTYLSAVLAEDNTVTRWRDTSEPIRVWVQPLSSEAGFSPELIAPTRRAFTAWNEVGLGVSFALVDDSTQADVHVTWSARMSKARQIGTTFRMTGGRGWIAFAHVQLCTSYDIYTVQNAARHEAGHVLGLGHSPNVEDIMAAETEGRQYRLTDADRATVLALYRLPPGRIAPN
jgi:predicted Zn-dependent protease